MPEPKKECIECSNKKDHDWGLCDCPCHSSSQNGLEWDEKKLADFICEMTGYGTALHPNDILPEIRKALSQSYQKGYDLAAKETRSHYYEKVDREARSDERSKVLNELKEEIRKMKIREGNPKDGYKVKERSSLAYNIALEKILNFLSQSEHKEDKGV